MSYSNSLVFREAGSLISFRFALPAQTCGLPPSAPSSARNRRQAPNGASSFPQADFWTARGDCTCLKLHPQSRVAVPPEPCTRAMVRME